jgi:hypothetical protein
MNTAELISLFDFEGFEIRIVGTHEKPEWVADEKGVGLTDTLGGAA